MATDIDILEQRLTEVRATREALRAKLDRLTAVEQRLEFALSVVKQVMQGASDDDLLAADQLLGDVSSRDLFADDGGDSRAAESLSLEALILKVFEARDGLTSVDVVDALQGVTTAKRESILSALSRACAKLHLRREGRLYFRNQVTIGDAPWALIGGAHGESGGSVASYVFRSPQKAVRATDPFKAAAVSFRARLTDESNENKG